MANSGLNASFSFAGTVYNADDCIQNTSLARSLNNVTYQCNGVMQNAAGANVYVFSYQLALANTDTAKISNLNEGSTGAFEYHPGGDSSGRIEMTSTRGLVTQANISAAANGYITLDGSIALDNLTDATAT